MEIAARSAYRYVLFLLEFYCHFVLFLFDFTDWTLVLIAKILIIVYIVVAAAAAAVVVLTFCRLDLVNYVLFRIRLRQALCYGCEINLYRTIWYLYVTLF